MSMSPQTRDRTALVAVSCGYFFVLLDVTIVNVALSHIGADLHASRSSLQWVVDGYALVLASLLLSAGDVADRVGSRGLLLGGLGLFGVASTVCAVAPSAAVLVAARALQGLGAAAILPSSLTLAGQGAAEESARAERIGIWAGVGSLALVAGPLLGGLLVSGLGWRSVFWLNLPLTVITAALVAATIERTDAHAGRRVDVTGQFTGALVLAGIVLAAIEAGRAGVASAAALVPAGVALVSLAAFLRIERRREQPMLDLRLFRRPSFTAANAGAGLMNLGTLGAIFVISLDLQQVHGTSALQTGVLMVPWALPLAVLAPRVGRLVGRIGPRWPAGLGLTAAGIGYAMLAVGGVSADPLTIGAPLLLVGLGLAAATPALVAGATSSVEPSRAGMAAAINNAARQSGGAVGVAAVGAVGSIHAALAVSAAALLFGGGLNLAFGRSVPAPGMY